VLLIGFSATFIIVFVCRYGKKTLLLFIKEQGFRAFFTKQKWLKNAQQQ